MTPWAVVENIVIYIIIAACVVAGLYFNAGWWGLTAMVMLFFVNTPTKPKD